jgi:hypothetical protein
MLKYLISYYNNEKKKSKYMTAFELKSIALIAMVVDHVGLFFFPSNLFLRVVGRIAFPIFAWLIANGARHTKNINAYIRRVFIFALISQPFFYLLNKKISVEYWGLNVLFTFFLALIPIYIIQKKKGWLLSTATTLICLFLAQVVHVDYGFLGVLSVILFYVFFERRIPLFFSQTIIYLTPAFIAYVEQKYSLPLNPLILSSYIEPFAIFALIFIFLYNQTEGWKAKYFFYVFYPAQYVLMYLIKIFF